MLFFSQLFTPFPQFIVLPICFVLFISVAEWGVVPPSTSGVALRRSQKHRLPQVTPSGDRCRGKTALIIIYTETLDLSSLNNTTTIHNVETRTFCANERRIWASYSFCDSLTVANIFLLTFLIITRPFDSAARRWRGIRTVCLPTHPICNTSWTVPRRRSPKDYPNPFPSCLHTILRPRVTLWPLLPVLTIRHPYPGAWFYRTSDISSSSQPDNNPSRSQIRHWDLPLSTRPRVIRLRHGRPHQALSGPASRSASHRIRRTPRWGGQENCWLVVLFPLWAYPRSSGAVVRGTEGPQENRPSHGAHPLLGTGRYPACTRRLGAQRGIAYRSFRSPSGRAILAFTSTPRLLTSFYVFDHRDRIPFSPTYWTHVWQGGQGGKRGKMKGFILWITYYGILPPIFLMFDHLFTFRSSSRSKYVGCHSHIVLGGYLTYPLPYYRL